MRLVRFVPPFTLSSPMVELDARIVAINSDGTVNVVALDGHDTPYENVPMTELGGPHPGNGPFVIAAAAALAHDLGQAAQSQSGTSSGGGTDTDEPMIVNDPAGHGDKP
jgi:hypothetical protein